MEGKVQLEANRSLFSEILLFLRQNKKWYLIPVIVAIVLMGILIALGGTAAAPFIYSLF